MGAATAAEVGQDHDQEMGGKPDVLIPHILIDIYEDQDSGNE